MAGSADSGPTVLALAPAAVVQLYASRPAGPVRWRLLGANHRDLGRGAHDFMNGAQCLEAVQMLARRLDQAAPSLSRAADGRWTWRLVLDGGVVARSSHGFDRRLRCSDAVRRFIRLTAVAQLRPEVVVLEHGGPVALPRQLLGEHAAGAMRLAAVVLHFDGTDAPR